MLYIFQYFHLNTQNYPFKFFSQLFNYKMIIISRAVMKHYRDFFRYFISQITNIMSCTSILTCVVTMISYFLLFFIIIIKFLFTYITYFLFIIMYFFLPLLMKSSFLFIVNYFCRIFSHIFAKFLHTIIPSIITNFIF